MAAPVFTIGHSTQDIDRVVDALAASNIDVVADVRSQPYSRFSPQFNREAIAAVLALAGIKYLFLGAELGARRGEPEAYEGEVATYERIAGCTLFRAGIERVRAGAERWRIALLCAEKDPIECHRMVLVGRHLALAGTEVVHILEGGGLEPNRDAERRLIRAAGLPEEDLFRCEAERLDEAYLIQGRRIAYRRDAASEVA